MDSRFRGNDEREPHRFDQIECRSCRRRRLACRLRSASTQARDGRGGIAKPPRTLEKKRRPPKRLDQGGVRQTVGLKKLYRPWLRGPDTCFTEIDGGGCEVGRPAPPVRFKSRERNQRYLQALRAKIPSLSLPSKVQFARAQPTRPGYSQG